MKQFIQRHSLLFVLGTVLSMPALAQDAFRIAYLPFSVESYVPITDKTIEQSAFINISVRLQKLPECIRSLIKPMTQRKLDGKCIRLLIVDGKSTYLFDRDGYGILNNQQPVSILTKEFEKLVAQDGIHLPLSPFPDAP